MNLKKRLMSICFSLAMAIACIMPQTAFAATEVNTDAEDTLIGTIEIIPTEDGQVEVISSSSDFVAEVSSAKSGQVIGSNGVTITNTGNITVSVSVSGQTAKTLKAMGYNSSYTSTAIFYGDGCGTGKEITLDGSFYTVTSSLNVTDSITYTISIIDIYHPYNIVLGLYN